MPQKLTPPPDEPMRPQLPDVAQLAAPGHNRFGQQIVSGVTHLFRFGRVDQIVDLSDREARRFEVELEIFHFHQSAKLLCEQFFVPSRIERQLVVGQHVSAFLPRRHLGEAHVWDFRHAQVPDSCDPAVACQDRHAIIEQNRIGKSEGLDAIGDLADLLAGMGACIALLGLEIGNRNLFDLNVGHGYCLRWNRSCL